MIVDMQWHQAGTGRVPEVRNVRVKDTKGLGHLKEKRTESDGMKKEQM